VTLQVFKVRTKACQELEKNFFLCSFRRTTTSQMCGRYISSSLHKLFRFPNSWTNGLLSWWRFVILWWIWNIRVALFWLPYMSRMTFQRSCADSKQLKIPARLCSIKLKFQDYNWSLDSHISYSRTSTSREDIEPFMNPNFDLPPRAIVTALDQER
jgi:hypothetical protein